MPDSVLMACAELSPLARTGGLGDAVAGLAAAVARAGVATTVVMPAYRDLGTIGEPVSGKPGPAVGLRRYRLGDVEVLLVEDPIAFDRPGFYGPSPGEAYEDEWWRWGRFAGAVADLAGDHDVLHMHDAHAGAAALLTAGPTVFTIHNPAHPVLGPLAEAADLLGVDPSATVPEGPLEWYGQANYLKAGLTSSDRASTVSPGFAAELAGPDGVSFGLGGVVRNLSRPMLGILNGIDATAWDPAADPLLPAPFDTEDLTGRAAARAELLGRTGLDEGVVFGMVGRMSAQKGIDLVDEVIDDLVDDGMRFVAVGNGDLDAVVDTWVDRHPAAVSHQVFGDEIARLTFGGCDAYLMPSRFEPSGLGQLYAMRYGAPPVVRYTGGLADSVTDIDEDPGAGTGVGFHEYSGGELAKTVRRAMRYQTMLPELWRSMQRRGMETDWSWDRRAVEYFKLYRMAEADASTGGA
jgi:starch synthase